MTTTPQTHLFQGPNGWPPPTLYTAGSVDTTMSDLRNWSYVTYGRDDLSCPHLIAPTSPEFHVWVCPLNLIQTLQSCSARNDYINYR